MHLLWCFHCSSLVSLVLLYCIDFFARCFSSCFHCIYCSVSFSYSYCPLDTHRHQKPPRLRLWSLPLGSAFSSYPHSAHPPGTQHVTHLHNSTSTIPHSRNPHSRKGREAEAEAEGEAKRVRGPARDAATHPALLIDPPAAPFHNVNRNFNRLWVRALTSVLDAYFRKPFPCRVSNL